MKTQDLSPSTILVLSVGLLIGSVLMPGRQKFEYTNELPTMETTLAKVQEVNVEEGRLLERLPDDMGSSTVKGRLSERPPDNFVKGHPEDVGGQIAHTKKAVIQELVDSGLAFVLDNMVILCLEVFAVLGVVVMRAIHEMVEQPPDGSERGSIPCCSSKTSELCADKFEPSRHSCHLFLKCGGLAASLVTACAMSSWSSQNPSEPFTFVENCSFEQLKKFVWLGGRPFQLSLAFVPDKVCMFWLGAFAVLGVAVMRVDIHAMAKQSNDASERVTGASSSSKEMAEQLADAAKHETTRSCSSETCNEDAEPSQHLWYMVLKMAIVTTSVAATLSRGVALLFSQRPLEGMGIIENTGTWVLKNFLQCADNILLFFLGAWAMLGVAIMHADICEMAEQYQDASVPEGIPFRSPEACLPDLKQDPRCSGNGFPEKFYIGDASEYPNNAPCSEKSEPSQQSQDPPEHGSTTSCSSDPCASCVGEADESHHSWREALTIAVVGASVAATMGRGVALLYSQTIWNRVSFVDNVAVLELKRFLQLADSSSDKVLLLILGACTMLGIAIMRVDVHEMAEQSQDPPERETDTSCLAEPCVACFEDADQSRHSWRVNMAVVGASVAATMGIGVAPLYSQTIWNRVSFLDNVGTVELQNFVPLADNSFDNVLLLILGACTALGIAIMRVDVHEMAEQSQDPPERKTDTSCLAEPCASCFEDADQSRHSWRDLLNMAVVGASVAATMGRGVASLYSQTIWNRVSFVDNVGIVELQNFVPLADSSSDNVLLLILGACTALGMAIMRVDVHEMAEQSEDATERETATSSSSEPCVSCVDEAEQSHPSWREVLKMIVFGVSAVALWHCGNFVDNIGIVELKNVVQLADSSSDSVLLLILGTCAALGMAIMRVDVHEMAEQSQDAPECEDAPERETACSSQPCVSCDEEADQPHHSWRKVGASMVATVGCGVALWYSQRTLEPISFVDNAGTVELANFVPFASTSSDNLLLLILGACTVLGMLVMRVDVHEMAEQAKDAPELETNPHDATRPCVSCVEDAQQSQHPWQMVAVGAGVVGAMARLVALWYSLRPLEPISFVDNVGTGELQNFVQFADSSSDNVLLFILAALTVLGMAVMRVDVHEMTEQSQDAPEFDTTPACSSRPCVSCVEGSEQSKHLWLMVGAAASLAAALARGVPLLYSLRCLEPIRFVDNVGIGELKNFVQFAESSSDNVLLLILGVCIVLGIAIMQVDVHEMSEQSQDGPEFKASASYSARPCSSCVAESEEKQSQLPWHMVLNIFVVAASVVASTGCGVALWYLQDSSEHISSSHNAGTVELKNFVQFANTSSDSVLLLIFGACTVLGMVIMRVDVHEMAEQAQGAPELETTAACSSSPCASCAEETEQPPQRSWHMILTIVVLATSVVAIAGHVAALWCSQSSVEAIGFVDSAGTVELKNFVQLVDMSFDNLLLFGLGVCTVLGMDIMRVDIHEMAEQSEDAPECDTPFVSPRPCVSHTEEADLSQHSWHMVLKIAVAATSVVAFVGHVTALWYSPSPVEPIGFVDSAATVELKNFVQLADIYFDNVLLFILGACTILGMAIMQVDVHEMAEQSEDAPECDAPFVSPRPCASRTEAQHSWHMVLKTAVAVTSVAAVVGQVVSFWFSTNPMEPIGFVDSAGIVELRNFVQPADGFSDNFLLLILGACAVLGVAITQVDVHEMAEHPPGASEHKTSRSCS